MSETRRHKPRLTRASEYKTTERTTVPTLDLVDSYTSSLSVYSWEHFTTLTFAAVVNRTFAENAFYAFVRQLEQRAQQRVDYFGTVETGAERGRVHIHAVVSGTSSLQPAQVDATWTRGISHTERYEPKFGVRYVAKSLHDADTRLLLSLRTFNE